ncbi:hypothetical protein GCM10009730_58910 [Streptomyces albidochromogenes]
MLLGVDPTAPRTNATQPLPARSTLLLYTDGLIERCGETLDHGLTRLRQHAAALARQPLEDVCDDSLPAWRPTAPTTTLCSPYAYAHPDTADSGIER